MRASTVFFDDVARSPHCKETLQRQTRHFFCGITSSPEKLLTSNHLLYYMPSLRGDVQRVNASVVGLTPFVISCGTRVCRGSVDSRDRRTGAAHGSVPAFARLLEKPSRTLA